MQDMEIGPCDARGATGNDARMMIARAARQEIAPACQLRRRGLPAAAMDSEARLKRLKFRAWHRGTREADYMIGGFFDRYHVSWDEAAITWFEDLIEEDDVEIMAWALGTQPAPERFAGEQMQIMQKLDYVEIPR